MRGEQRLTGDLAKNLIAEDEFGLDQITESLSAILSDRIAADSYTIGIEGDWGAGKTSLINFICQHIKAQKKIYQHIVYFQPWLIGTKEDLLAAFLGLLRIEIKRFAHIPHIAKKLETENAQLIPKILAGLQRYATHLEKGSESLDLASTFDPSGKSKAVAIFLKILGKLASLVPKEDLTLEELKARIVHDLRTLGNLLQGVRFTVIIDDLDRLEPTESVEILRLVKAVADFPTVTYLICFDRSILAHQVESVTGVPDGHKYVEKIFQNFISLPPQEPFALRRFTRKLLASSFPAEFSDEALALTEKSVRQEVVFDRWIGKFIQTPRDAVRLWEAVKLGWIYLQDKADFFDYVWLQLIKLKCFDLYSWTRIYVTNLGSFRDGGRPGDTEPISDAQQLIEILTGLGWGADRDYCGLGYMLPGVEKYAIPGKPRVYQIEGSELAEFENERRLGSPSHWRLYFSFDIPSYALDDDIQSAFLRAVLSDQNEAAKILLDAYGRQHEERGFYLKTFLERLFDRLDNISATQKIGIAQTLAQTMDQVAQAPRGGFRFQDIWRRALRLLTPEVAPSFSDLVSNGSSVNWLAEVVRDQGFAHGLPESGRRRIDRAWLNEAQLRNAVKIITDRFQEMGLDDILQKPQPLDILFCWIQLGDEKGLRKIIAEYVRDDLQFLHLLEALRSVVTSTSRGSFYTLRSNYVETFLDEAEAKFRLEKLTESADVTGEIRGRARALLDAWNSHNEDRF